MESNILKVVSSALPTIASALLSPLAGTAVAGVCKLLDIDPSDVDSVAERVADAIADPDSLLKLKQLEKDLRQMELDNGFRFAELEVRKAELAIRDVDSARAREAAVRDQTNRVLAFLIVGTFLLVVGLTLTGKVAATEVIAGTLIGYLSAKAEQVLSYYFGSTAGSRFKTELLAGGKQQ